MTSSEATQVWDNTGSDSPDLKPTNWSLAKTPWPTGPFENVIYLFPPDDPRSALIKRAEQRLLLDSQEAWVLVKESEIKAILHLRTCRSTHVFDRDGGKIEPFTAHCILQAGHTGSHGNGYFTWKPELIVVK